MVSLKDWAEHRLYFEDGRFATDVAFSFIALNMVNRRMTREQSSWFVKGHLDDAPTSVGDVQERVQNGMAVHVYAIH
jgi:hypothetical protein